MGGASGAGGLGGAAGNPSKGGAAGKAGAGGASGAGGKAGEGGASGQGGSGGGAQKPAESLQTEHSGQSKLMEKTFAGNNKCNPKNHNRPFIIEWDATDMSSFESRPPCADA